MIETDTAASEKIGQLLEHAWAQGLATRPVLDAQLIAGEANLSVDWYTRLEVLCRALKEEAQLNAVGLTSAYAQLRKLVKARRRLQKLARIAHRPVIAPVLIVGQMRSGTTRIHRLLACDRRFVTNRLYEQLDPVPYHWPFDPRPVAAGVTNAGLKLLNRGLAAIHPTAALAPEEDFGLHAFSIWGAQFEGQWLVPSYAEFVEQADPREVYREFDRLIGINAWKRRLDPARRWLLKAPQFTQELDAVLAQFPDARMIVLRRDPVALVGSSASLVWNHARVQSDGVTREAVGREWLRKTKLRGKRMEAALARHRGGPQVVLDYRDVSHDWRRAVGEIYAMLGWSLNQETTARMEQLMARSTAHEGHQYDVADFGLDRKTVAAAFA